MSKIVVVGGHHNSALALSRELIAQGHQVEWIGHRTVSPRETADSAEYQEVVSAGIPFHNLRAGKSVSSYGLKNYLNIPLGVWRARVLLARLKPQAVISFGGYLGLAVSLAASFCRVKLYLHEQTTQLGLANFLSSIFAKRIFLTWDSSLENIPRPLRAKTLVTGLPLRQKIFTHHAKPPLESSFPLLLIMGGKQGAHSINKIIFAALPDLLNQYSLIHQTGNSLLTQDYQRAQKIKHTLPEKLSHRYLPTPYILESEIGHFLHYSDYYLGRSGAHIIYELAVLGKAAVLIPYPHAAKMEQTHNAQILASAGNGLILEEAKLSISSLCSSLNKLAQLTPQSLKLPLNASATIAKEISHDLA